MKKAEMIIEVCIPHQMPPKVYAFYDQKEFSERIIEEAHGYTAGIHCWQEWTKQSAIDCWGEGEVPTELAALLETHEKIIERNGEYLTPEEAGLEVDWAIETVGRDYNSHRVMTGDEAIEMALGECKFHQGLKVRRMLRDILKAELDKIEWPKEWQIEAIISEMMETEELEEGEAMYFDKASGQIEIGKDGCQQAGTICLRVGPDNVGNLDIGEIRSALEQQIGGDA